MDMNELLSRHQISLIRADAESCSELRFGHIELAAQYATRIQDLQLSLGNGGHSLVAPALPGQPAIYGGPIDGERSARDESH